MLFMVFGGMHFTDVKICKKSWFWSYVRRALQWIYSCLHWVASGVLMWVWRTVN